MTNTRKSTLKHVTNGQLFVNDGKEKILEGVIGWRAHLQGTVQRLTHQDAEARRDGSTC